MTTWRRHLPSLLLNIFIFIFIILVAQAKKKWSTEKFTINIDFSTPTIPLPSQVFILVDSPEAKPKSGALAALLLRLLLPLGWFFSHATARNRNVLRSRGGRQLTTTTTMGRGNNRRGIEAATATVTTASTEGSGNGRVTPKHGTRTGQCWNLLLHKHLHLHLTLLWFLTVLFLKLSF